MEHTDGSANMAMSVDESGHARWHPHAPLGISIDEVADEIRHRQLAQVRIPGIGSMGIFIF